MTGEQDGTKHPDDGAEQERTKHPDTGAEQEATPAPEPGPLKVGLKDDVLTIGSLEIVFHRTLRIPDDGRDYPLPASLGRFPVRRIADHLDSVPEAWRAHGGVFLPVWQREAMWLGFTSRRGWKPTALKVAVGKVNALSGKPWDEALHWSGDAATQDYVVVPGQPWLDGINAGRGRVRQFVAMPLGMGYSVEAQVTGTEEHGGLQLLAIDPKPGRFPDEPPQRRVTRRRRRMSSAPAGAAMGVAAGGSMRQTISVDPHGVDTWDPRAAARVFVHLVNAQEWTAITGERLPPTPVTKEEYEDAGIPWFEVYDDGRDVDAPAVLANVQSVKDKDAEHGFVGLQDDGSLTPTPPIRVPDTPGRVTDGDW